MPSRDRLRRLNAVSSVRRAGLAAVCVLASACGQAAPSTSTERAAYLEDARMRRSELEASLVNPTDGYAALRLASYATGRDGDWDELPEWNPAVAVVSTAELDAAGGGPSAPAAAEVPLALPADPVHASDSELVALGKLAFARYPVALTPEFDVAVASADAARSYGLWLDDTRGVSGLLHVRMADGTTRLGFTCSTCHAAPGPSGIEDGLPNAKLDLGAMLVDSGAAGDDAATLSATRAWGPGRLDVTTPRGTEPVRISDLRPTRFLGYLQHDATVRMRDTTALAIRIETLIITSSGQVLRPPRIVPWALAVYLETLAGSLPRESDARRAFSRGAAVFDENCSSCHASPALTGAPVPLDVVGTDPTLGLSTDRGTGTYRVPSLHGVGTRGPLLHDSSVASLQALFDPARLSPTFVGGRRGTGAVSGHVFGLGLDDSDRAALVAYLQAL